MARKRAIRLDRGRNVSFWMKGRLPPGILGIILCKILVGFGMEEDDAADDGNDDDVTLFFLGDSINLVACSRLVLLLQRLFERCLLRDDDFIACFDVVMNVRGVLVSTMQELFCIMLYGRIVDTATAFCDCCWNTGLCRLLAATPLLCRYRV